MARHYSRRTFLGTSVAGLVSTASTAERFACGAEVTRESLAFDAFCPVRNLSAKYPPTLLIHGTKDIDVPHEQSVVMDRELSRHGVPHELISVPAPGTD